MARLSYVEPHRASPEVREINQKTLRGNPNNAEKILAHSPKVIKNFLALYATVGRSLERRLYEMVLHPGFDDQRLPLLYAAPSRFVEASRTTADLEFPEEKI